MYFNKCNAGCGCNANYTYPSPCTANYAGNVNNNGCGCGYRGMDVAPITAPERVNYTHCCHVHEQPIIVPTENRMVHHHTFAPRYYGVSRVTHEDVVEANPYVAMNNANGCGNNGLAANNNCTNNCANNGCSNICPNFRNM